VLGARHLPLGRIDDGTKSSCVIGKGVVVKLGFSWFRL
jgi:hypothetical protein